MLDLHTDIIYLYIYIYNYRWEFNNQDKNYPIPDNMDITQSQMDVL